MRNWCLIIFLILSAKSIAQNQNRAVLNLQSTKYKLAVTKGENLFVVTRAGEVAGTRSINDYWRELNLTGEDKMDILGPTLDNGNFFNADTGFVSGFISNNGKYDIIYKTTDAGKTWSKVNFGQSGWVDDAINLDNGEAWLSVAGSGIAYTSDYGSTWKKFDIPERKQRFASIFFNAKHEGVVGSLWDMIAVTKDNCKTWTLLPTPLSQKKYKKTDLNSRPEINKVALFKNYVLCAEDGLVFYSEKDSINWMLLPDYVSFCTDPENSALYFLDSKNQFLRSDSTLKPNFTTPAIGGSTYAVCKNGKLFVFGGTSVTEIKSDNSLNIVTAYLDESSKIAPTIFGYAASGTYGLIGSDIYVQKEYQGEWTLIQSLPFDTDSGSLSLVDDGYYCYSRYDDSVFYYSALTKKVIKQSKSGIFNSFSKSQIKQIIFEKGSYGCYHSYSDHAIYTLDGNAYTLENSSSRGSKHANKITESPDEISADAVIQFANNLPTIVGQFACIKDLEFTEQDYENCKKNIKIYQASVENPAKVKKEDKLPFVMYKNNIDFERLLATVDSVKTMDSVKLNFALAQLSEMWSTTTNWIGFKLLNKNGEELSFTNRNYESNAFYVPWSVSINGYVTANTNTAITKFIKQVYPEFLSDKNKVEVLQTLVKKMY